MSISYNALLVVVFFFAAFAAGQETLQQYPASPPPAPPALVPFFNKTKITVCVSDWTVSNSKDLSFQALEAFIFTHNSNSVFYF